MEVKSNLVRRDLDGIYVRVKIGDKYDNCCLTDMSWDEVTQWLTERWKNQEVDLETKINNLFQVAEHFHRRLRLIGDAIDLYGRNEIETQSSSPE